MNHTFLVTDDTGFIGTITIRGDDTASLAVADGREVADLAPSLRALERLITCEIADVTVSL